MTGGALPIVLFLAQIFFLYILSHVMINEFYYVLHLFTRNTNIVFSLLAVFFLPGTIVHEVSHFLAAIILFLPVGEIRIMPQWDKNHIELGRVTYGKKDIIRSILVGIAPFFGALFFFWFLGAFRLFPSTNILITVLMGYLVFAVSSNMFSSRQDLIDLVYLIPLALIAGLIVYITGVDLSKLIPPSFVGKIAFLLQSVNFYITISLGIHLAVIVFFKSLRLIFRR